MCTRKLNYARSVSNNSRSRQSKHGSAPVAEFDLSEVPVMFAVGKLEINIPPPSLPALLLVSCKPVAVNPWVILHMGATF